MTKGYDYPAIRELVKKYSYTAHILSHATFVNDFLNICRQNPFWINENDLRDLGI